MKIFVILLVLLFINNISPAQTDWDQGNRITEALASLMLIYEMAKEIDEEGNIEQYGISSINGAYLRMGEKAFIQTTFYKGDNYIFMAGGDERTFDVDIIIKNEYETVIERDLSHEKYAIIFFEPPYTGEYIIELSTPGVSKSGFGIITFFEKGVYTDTYDILEALENMEARWEHWNNKYDTRFASDPESLKGKADYRSFCFNGHYLLEGDTYGYTGNGMRPHKDYIIMASGDNNSVDIDLTVTFGGIEKSDSFDNVIPIIFFNSSNSREYDYTVKNYKSYGKSFIITCTLEVL